MSMGRTQDVGPSLIGQVDVVGVAPSPSKKTPILHPRCCLSKTKFHGSTPFVAMSIILLFPASWRNSGHKNSTNLCLEMNVPMLAPCRFVSKFGIRSLPSSEPTRTKLIGLRPSRIAQIICRFILWVECKFIWRYDFVQGLIKKGAYRRPPSI